MRVKLSNQDPIFWLRVRKKKHTSLELDANSHSMYKTLFNFHTEKLFSVDAHFTKSRNTNTAPMNWYIQ